MDTKTLAEELQEELIELKEMIKLTLHSVILDNDDLSKVFALGMAIDPNMPSSTREIARKQVLGI